ncbi:DEAD/DEAH box helicase [Leucothrix sargassi]|nr:DEAD/DEAH box helicase [Leucothrix sargassi]
MITNYHAKYYAHELSKHHASDSMGKLAGTLTDVQAKVDLNPHQVEAALFAFKSPLSNGAILADEVGLGKTIEAGLVLSQKWAEQKRRILIIVPASLRKQWQQELADKFYLPSHILEAKTFKDAIKAGSLNPFEHNEILICSYPFAARQADNLMLVQWDLVVLDEAHRMRNVYKKQNKTARALRTALVNAPKVLLTATPLQNSLMELYGLVSFIDEYAFGDEKSFRNQYAKITSEEQFEQLKRRLKPLCHRTLRRQVLDIKYTQRLPITKEFEPTSDEQELYDMVSEYLQRPELNAMPNAQRMLMTLVLRKLLASSTFAIAGALDTLSNKLKQQLVNHQEQVKGLQGLEEDFEGIQDYADEFPDLEAFEPLSEEELVAIENEAAELEAFSELASSITQNAKGLALLDALKSGFAKAKDLGAQDKAIIFTESRRTQNYLVELLTEHGYGDSLVLFNGANTDPKSREIYSNWKAHYQGTDEISGSRTSDMRAALVEYFRDSAQIMIATEAAAEGINLQFCSLLVNYDLPWNPQRIEQRIGRCHRYGQKHDVVVINFLNRANAADQRVFELLDEKLKLFSGVFGASDEVLGAIESGIDFEKRIAEVYQTCRTKEEIDANFEALREEMEEQISDAMNSTRQQLLENFDAEVHDKLKVNLEESKAYLDKYKQLLWELTCFGLNDYAEFDEIAHRFNLMSNPANDASIETGQYELVDAGKQIEAAHGYRIGHPLAQYLIQQYAKKELDESELTFNYHDHTQTILSLEALIGQRGSLALHKLSIRGVDFEDHLIFIGYNEKGEQLSSDQMQRMFTLPVTEVKAVSAVKTFDNEYAQEKAGVLDSLQTRYGELFEHEMEKLDGWASDKRNALKSELNDYDSQIKELKKLIRTAKGLPEKIAYQRRAQKLEKSRDEAWREYDEQAKTIENQKDSLLDNIEERLKITQHDECLFAIGWRLV